MAALPPLPRMRRGAVTSRWRRVVRGARARAQQCTRTAVQLEATRGYLCRRHDGFRRPPINSKQLMEDK